MLATSRGTQGRNLGAHQSAVSLVEIQHPHAIEVAALIEIASQKGLRVASMRPRLEIHAEEGNFVGHIDPPERWLELRAVERHQFFADADHVATVQVAVT